MDPANQDYETRERTRFQAELALPDKNTTAEKREDTACYQETLATDPDKVAERIVWLLDGNYGYGAMLVSREVQANKRMNRQAWLCAAIAALEWRVPASYARKAWKALTPEQKEALSESIGTALVHWLDNQDA